MSRHDPRVDDDFRFPGKIDRSALEEDEAEILDRLSPQGAVHDSDEDLDVEDILPRLPEIPGWHVCYLSTTHRTDTIWKRERLGYVPVTDEDLPEGMRNTMRLKDGDNQGKIGFGEMLAYKIPVDRYSRLMRMRHHQRPLEFEEQLKANAFSFLKDRKGAPLITEVGNGILDLGGRVREPVFQP